jgi:hypothetical protein
MTAPAVGGERGTELVKERVDELEKRNLLLEKGFVARRGVEGRARGAGGRGRSGGVRVQGVRCGRADHGAAGGAGARRGRAGGCVAGRGGRVGDEGVCARRRRSGRRRTSW